MNSNLKRDRNWENVIASMSRYIEDADDRDLDFAWWNQGLKDPRRRDVKFQHGVRNYRTKVVK